MNELIVIVEEAPDGGFTARALGLSIFTEADTLGELPGKSERRFVVNFGEVAFPKRYASIISVSWSHDFTQKEMRA